MAEDNKKEEGVEAEKKDQAVPTATETESKPGGAVAPAGPVADGEYNPKAVKTAQAIFVPVTASYKEKGSFHDYVDAIRLDFKKDYGKTKIVNWSVLAIVLLLSVGTVVAAFLSSSDSGNTWGNYVIWPLFALAIVGFVVYLIISSSLKKKNYKSIAVYLDRWAESQAAVAYLDEDGITSAQYSCDGKVRDIDVINTHYWARINAIDSRNRVVAKFLGRELTDTEISVSVPPYSEFVKDLADVKVVEEPQEKAEPAALEAAEPVKEETKKAKAKPKAIRAQDVGAFGKILTYDLKASEGNVLIVVRKVSDSYLPTHVKALVSLPALARELGPDFVVYASSLEFAEAVLSAKGVKEELQGLVDNTVLFDWFFAFNSHGSYFVFNYSDDIMVLPVYVTPASDKLMEYATDVKHALAVFKSLADNKIGA